MSFHLLTVAKRGSSGPTKKLTLLRTESLVLCSKRKMRISFLRHFVSKAWIFFSGSKQGLSLTATEEDGEYKSLVQLELACEANDVASSDIV